jgi:hypothetical protein
MVWLWMQVNCLGVEQDSWFSQQTFELRQGISMFGQKTFEFSQETFAPVIASSSCCSRRHLAAAAAATPPIDLLLFLDKVVS